MKKLLHGGVGILVASAMALVVVMSYRSVNAQNALLPSGTSCPASLTTSIVSGAVLQGMIPLNLGVPTTTTTTFVINRVVFLVDGNIIGEARSNTTTNNSWFMPWATSFSTPGAHQLSARVLYNQSQICQTPAIPINLANSTISGSTMSVNVAPSQWVGLTNTAIDFNALTSLNSAEATNIDLQQYAYYEWNTNFGSIAPSRGVAHFSSGPSAGSGRVYLKVLYGGKQAVREIPVTVESQTTTPVTTNPSPIPTGGTDTSGSGSLTPTTQNTDTSGATPPIAATVLLTPEQLQARIVSQIESQPEILSCTNLNLTAARIDLLKTQARRLLSEEFRSIRGCFAQLNYVVPAAYAPVAPERIKTAEVLESNQHRINNASTETSASTDTGEKITKLRFQGQAQPNSDVLLYVFSEPLVLYAKADENGNWVYDLVDPLEPGSHEAYAVVESTDGTYKKSSAFSFLIETAQASAENPNGYSLSVQTVSSLASPASKRSANLYIISAIVAVVTVMASGTVLLLRTLKHVPTEPDDSSGGDEGQV